MNSVAKGNLLEGMVGADLNWIHTYDDMRHFLSAVGRITGLSSKVAISKQKNRIHQCGSFPMGNWLWQVLANQAKSRKTQNIVSWNSESQLSDQNLIINHLIDWIIRKVFPSGFRLSPTIFLQEHKELHGKVAMIMIGCKSRQKYNRQRAQRRNRPC